MSKKLSPDLIAGKALELIIRKKGSTGVNFREIARELQCAHTSLYNHFSSFDTLLIAAAKEGISKMRRETGIPEGKESPGIMESIEGVIDFFLNNEGIFRFLWVENRSLEMSRALEGAPRPEELFIPLLVKSLNRKISRKEALRRLSIAHGYLVGELIKFFNQRSLFKSAAVLKTNLPANIRSILIF